LLTQSPTTQNSDSWDGKLTKNGRLFRPKIGMNCI
jgi:hypothetical protein